MGRRPAAVRRVDHLRPHGGLTFESEYSGEELNAALEFAYSGGRRVSGDVSVTYKGDIISKSKITAFILGGSGGDAAQTIDSYDALIDFINAGR